ncbi:hypothetical protein GALMADRAFT_402353 [Galerina marginata CBS 339.88]|uniref:Uncharacterized protein n=1 Tax=Galerina marginata (strain CBS 339.88) TaxID=685588 RepID=A0A067TSD8_GALM3|nr:hypothetical protein GALMADRAFT_402353 [Galerina marginata CBS 339.88]
MCPAKRLEFGKNVEMSKEGSEDIELPLPKIKAHNLHTKPYNTWQHEPADDVSKCAIFLTALSFPRSPHLVYIFLCPSIVIDGQAKFHHYIVMNSRIPKCCFQ